MTIKPDIREYTKSGYYKCGSCDVTSDYRQEQHQLAKDHSVSPEQVVLLDHDIEGEICVYVGGRWCGYLRVESGMFDALDPSPYEHPVLYTRIVKGDCAVYNDSIFVEEGSLLRCVYNALDNRCTGVSYHWTDVIGKQSSYCVSYYEEFEYWKK